MATPKVEVRGLRELERKLEALGKDLAKELVRGMEIGNDLIKSRMPPYPPPSGAPFSFVSEKQRLFVIASIAEGTLDVPYKRAGSGGIGGSINTDVRTIGSTVVGVIGSASEHSPWVISDSSTGGRGPQSAYHKGNWWTLQRVVEDNIDGYVDILRKVLTDVIS